MLRDGRLCETERLHEVAQAHGLAAAREQVDDPHTGRVRQRGEERGGGGRLCPRSAQALRGCRVEPVADPGSGEPTAVERRPGVDAHCSCSRLDDYGGPPLGLLVPTPAVRLRLVVLSVIAALTLAVPTAQAKLPLRPCIVQAISVRCGTLVVPEDRATTGGTHDRPARRRDPVTHETGEVRCLYVPRGWAGRRRRTGHAVAGARRLGPRARAPRHRPRRPAWDRRLEPAHVPAADRPARDERASERPTSARASPR